MNKKMDMIVACLGSEAEEVLTGGGFSGQDLTYDQQLIDDVFSAVESWANRHNYTYNEDEWVFE